VLKQHTKFKNYSDAAVTMKTV